MAHVTSNIEYHSQRIRLAFNKDVRKQLFDDFGNQNSRLRDILGSSDRLAGLRRARVSTAVSSALWKFWNHGNAVFDLLTEAWSCKCQVFHHANLLLQHRVVPTVNFRVVFWFKTHLAGGTPSAQLPWAWQDTSIKLLEDTPTPMVMKIPVPIQTKSPVPVVKDVLTPSKTSQQKVLIFSSFQQSIRFLAAVDRKHSTRPQCPMPGWTFSELTVQGLECSCKAQDIRAVHPFNVRSIEAHSEMQAYPKCLTCPGLLQTSVSFLSIASGPVNSPLFEFSVPKANSPNRSHPIDLL